MNIPWRRSRRTGTRRDVSLQRTSYYYYYLNYIVMRADGGGGRGGLIFRVSRTAKLKCAPDVSWTVPSSRRGAPRTGWSEPGISRWAND